MATITIEYNVRSGKFVHMGKDALDYTSESKALTLSKREIMAIVTMHERGVYADMLDENCISRKERIGKSNGALSKFFRKLKVKKVKKAKPETKSEPTKSEPTKSEATKSES